VQLFGDVGHDWVETKSGRLDASEGEDVVTYDFIWIADERIAERDIDAEGAAVEFAGEAAF
tara:strand:+ start:56555 stop:56737 length:183 start_codon:yes stop_codon:yes gene_type:complete